MLTARRRSMSSHLSLLGAATLMAFAVSLWLPIRGLSADTRTFICVGSKYVGFVDRDRTGGWFEGDDECGNWITRDGLRRLLVGAGFAKDVFGYMKRVSGSRWDFYRHSFPSDQWSQSGYARRVDVARWNVYRRRHLIGHTEGPDGAAASTALLEESGGDLSCLKGF